MERRGNNNCWCYLFLNIDYLSYTIRYKEKNWYTLFVIHHTIQREELVHITYQLGIAIPIFMVTFWVGAVGKIILSQGICEMNCSATSAKPLVFKFLIYIVVVVVVMLFQTKK